MGSELGSFLRARRADAALTPGHSQIGQRRVTGLRREEVAAAAGISIDYYVRLEQGRERNPSDSVLGAIARVLRLDDDAVQHLRKLRDGVVELTQNLQSGETAARMQLLVEAVRPNPAYVLDRLSTIVAANREGFCLFDGIQELPPERRNTLRYLLIDARARTAFLEWEEIVRGAVGQLRAANAEDLNDPQLQEFVAELSSASELFSGWWRGHVVHRRRSSTKRILSAEGVAIARRYEVLHLPDDRMRMTIWLPVM